MSTKDFLEKDYYAALGVPKDAAPEEIKKAYRKLARQYHPDANKGDATSEDRFKAISEAYDVLSDPSRRKEYDDARALFGSGGPGGFRAPGGRPTPNGGFTFDVGDLGDLFGSTTASGGLGDVLGGLFNRPPRSSAGTGPRRGADVESEVRLNFGEAVEGLTVSLRMTGEQPCPVCHGTGAQGSELPHTCPTCAGTGQTSRNAGGFAFAEPCRECRGRGLVVDNPCSHCSGSGRALSTRTLNVRIPSGVHDGQRIRIKGKGAPGERGGPAGDLYVTVHVRPHRLFGRKGDSITVTVPVTFPEAALGGELKVPTLGGTPVTLKLPAGTATGRTFRVRGKGVPRKDGTRGDLLVTVEVAVPQKLSERAREAVETLREATGGDDPRARLMEQASKER